MAYFDTYNKDRWHKLAENYDLFKPYPLNSEDQERALVMADELINKYQQRRFSYSESLDFNQVLQKAANAYYNLGLYTCADKAVSILSQIQYQDNCSYYEGSFTVQSVMVRTGAMICKKPYYVEVPREFSSSSIHFMAHEIAHMLKESNPYECLGVHTDLEVIPILIELISAYVNGDNNVFKSREIIMLGTARDFKKLHEDYINNRIKPEDMNAFMACYRQNMMYLNSFYYTLRLFSMYLDDDVFVLAVIDNVLRHKLTTKEVIDYFLSNDDYTYESGMDHFRSRLK